MTDTAKVIIIDAPQEKLAATPKENATLALINSEENVRKNVRKNSVVKLVLVCLAGLAVAGALFGSSFAVGRETAEHDQDRPAEGVAKTAELISIMEEPPTPPTPPPSPPLPPAPPPPPPPTAPPPPTPPPVTSGTFCEDANEPGDPEFCNKELTTFIDKLAKCKGGGEIRNKCMSSCGLCPRRSLPPPLPPPPSSPPPSPRPPSPPPPSPPSSATVVLDGIYSSFKTGGSPNDVVDRCEARQVGNHVTFYRNGAVGQTTPILSATATAGESYTVEGNTLSGAVTGTVNLNGDIVWSHGYTSRKQSSAASAATVVLDGI